MGPNWLLGCKIVTGVPDAIPVIGGPIVELLRGGVGVVNQL
jgi:quinol-cytochrome oxidoreductase complex cytochrome b subunit